MCEKECDAKLFLEFQGLPWTWPTALCLESLKPRKVQKGAFYTPLPEAVKQPGSTLRTAASPKSKEEKESLSLPVPGDEGDQPSV